jgi:hypothetical protein
MNTMLSAAQRDDAELVTASLAGDRDAFGQIVSRYQALVCALAYSATAVSPKAKIRRRRRSSPHGSISGTAYALHANDEAAWKSLPFDESYRPTPLRLV